eukprot:310276-Chlamydomonas_euryale.AAC.1
MTTVTHFTSTHPTPIQTIGNQLPHRCAARCPCVASPSQRPSALGARSQPSAPVCGVRHRGGGEMWLGCSKVWAARSQPSAAAGR